MEKERELKKREGEKDIEDIETNWWSQLEVEMWIFTLGRVPPSK